MSERTRPILAPFDEGGGGANAVKKTNSEQRRRRDFVASILEGAWKSPQAKFEQLTFGMTDDVGRVTVGYYERGEQRIIVKFRLRKAGVGKPTVMRPGRFDSDYGWLFEAAEVDRESGSSLTPTTFRVNPARSQIFEEVDPERQAFRDHWMGVKNFKGKKIVPRTINSTVTEDMMRQGYVNLGGVFLDEKILHARVYLRGRIADGQIKAGDRVLIEPELDPDYGYIFKAFKVDSDGIRRALSTHRVVRDGVNVLEEFDPVAQSWRDFINGKHNKRGEKNQAREVRVKVYKNGEAKTAHVQITERDGPRIGFASHKLRRFTTVDIVPKKIDPDYGQVFAVFGVIESGERGRNSLGTLIVNRNHYGFLEFTDLVKKSWLDFFNRAKNINGLPVYPRSILVTASNGQTPFVRIGSLPDRKVLGFYFKGIKAGEKVVVDPFQSEGSWTARVFSVLRSPLDGQYYRYKLLRCYKIDFSSPSGFRLSNDKGYQRPRRTIRITFSKEDALVLKELEKSASVAQIATAINCSLLRAETLVRSVFGKLANMPVVIE